MTLLKWMIPIILSVTIAEAGQGFFQPFDIRIGQQCPMIPISDQKNVLEKQIEDLEIEKQTIILQSNIDKRVLETHKENGRYKKADFEYCEQQWFRVLRCQKYVEQGIRYPGDIDSRCLLPFPVALCPHKTYEEFLETRSLYNREAFEQKKNLETKLETYTLEILELERIIAQKQQAIQLLAPLCSWKNNINKGFYIEGDLCELDNVNTNTDGVLISYTFSCYSLSEYIMKHYADFVLVKGNNLTRSNEHGINERVGSQSIYVYSKNPKIVLHEDESVFIRDDDTYTIELLPSNAYTYYNIK